MNPLRRLIQLSADDAAIKLIFDHIRTLGLYVLMTGSAVYSLGHPEILGPLMPTVAFGSRLALCALLLTTLNAMHALRKAMALTNPWERVALIVVVNAIGPVMILALIIVGPIKV